ncbi:E3 ubiquitin-protein ligase RAD18-like [Antedon mediterranea]|uniref:E3 ubiquitin-protein ligase RAD18-like n=1 Tax=Antedon mediterranea TaxID=105859 RepID=UPI003AF4CF98
MEVLTVTDPTDWPSTMPELRTIDTLLRCPICYEFLKTSMMVPECSHNFCSLCIRTYMAYKNQCPTCSVSFLETNLKNNRLLDDIVKNFLAVRPQILKLCSDKGNQVPASTSASEQTRIKQTSSDGPSRSASQTTFDKIDLSKEYFKSSLPKKSPSASKSSSDVDDPDFEPFTKSPRVRTPKRTLNRKRCKTLASSTEEDEEDERAKPGSSKQKTNENPCSLTIPSPITPSTVANNNTRASCPVCGVSVLERFINNHLDKCLAGEGKKESLRSKKRPLLKFVYNLMSDKELRKKLKEYNVTNQGARPVLIKRLKDFSLLYNSYCDTDNPKSVEAISKEFAIAQKQKLKHSNETVKDRLVVEKGNTDEQFDKSRKKYLESHKSQFSKMIEETKRRQQEMKAKANKSKAPSTDTTSSSSIGSLEEAENKEIEDKLATSSQAGTLSTDPLKAQTPDLTKSSQVVAEQQSENHQLDVEGSRVLSTKSSYFMTSESSEATQETNEVNALVLTPQSEISADEEDKGQNNIVVSPVFPAKVSRRVGTKRKDDRCSEDGVESRRSKRNKPDSQ